MCEPIKPTLVVHPSFVKLIGDFELKNYFNILLLEDLERCVEEVSPILFSDTDIKLLDKVELEPYFSQSYRSGMKPYYTSYSFDTKIPIYRITDRAPRYVIWNKEDPLTICATYIDRVDEYDLYEACRRAKDWSYLITITESIIVFDLDETLIDKNGNKLKCADKILDCSRNLYDRLVLYSHGSSLHVDEHVAKFNKSVFDLILSNNIYDKKSSKNLLYLYNHFPNTIFTQATLVDDSLYNWTPEYDKMLVPYRVSTLQNLLPLIGF